MASSRYLITSTTLSSSASSVTFSSIPSTYTDLVLKASVRASNAGTYRELYIQYNSSTAANYSDTALLGNGSSGYSQSNSANTYIYDIFGNADSSTANTFSNHEFYIPNYTSSAKKPMSNFSVTENNGTTAYITATAGLWSLTNAITDIKIAPIAANFLSGSSFYLYGIKNS